MSRCCYECCGCCYNCLLGTFNFLLRYCCCCFGFYCRIAVDSDEKGCLLPKSINVTTSPSQAFCRSTFQNFQNKYLPSCKLEWKDLQTIENTVIVICVRTSRLEDDITETLNSFKITDQSNIMLIVMHHCERGVEPEDLLTENRDNRISCFANIVYSDSEQCYDCQTNRQAVKAIKDFVKK